MVEISLEPGKENKNKALNVLDHIRSSLPEYLIIPDSLVFDHFLKKGKLYCYITIQESKKFLGVSYRSNVILGKLIYQGNMGIYINTDDANKVIKIAEQLERVGYTVRIWIHDEGKW